MSPATSELGHVRLPRPLRVRGGARLAEVPAESHHVGSSVQGSQGGLSWPPWQAAVTLSAKAEPREGLK